MIRIVYLKWADPDFSPWMGGSGLFYLDYEILFRRMVGSGKFSPDGNTRINFLERPDPVIFPGWWYPFSPESQIRIFFPEWSDPFSPRCGSGLLLSDHFPQMAGSGFFHLMVWIRIIFPVGRIRLFSPDGRIRIVFYRMVVSGLFNSEDRIWNTFIDWSDPYPDCWI